MQIKSIYGKYKVIYGDSNKQIQKVKNPFIIMDNNIQRLYPKLKYKNSIYMNATENAKELSKIKLFTLIMQRNINIGDLKC